MKSSKTPYTERSWIRRRLSFWRRKWIISQDTQGNGVFSTQQAIPGTSVWDSLDYPPNSTVGHARISFLSQRYVDRSWWYGATVLSVEQAALEMLEEKIDQEVDKFITSKGLDLDSVFGLLRHEDGALSVPGSFKELADSNGTPRSGWDCHRDAWRDITHEDWENLPLQLGVRLDLSSPHFVGLDAVVQHQALNQEILIDFVNTYLKSGEVEFSKPVNWVDHSPNMEKLVKELVEFYQTLGKNPNVHVLNDDYSIQG